MVEIATFTPPLRTTVPAVAADTPNWQRKPAIWNKTGLIQRGVNVYKLTNGTYTETQPFSNVPFSGGWELVATVYYGGHSYTVTSSEAAALTAAGYGANLT